MWPCFDCQKQFPANALAEREKETMTNAKCFALGHWRACSACAASHIQGQIQITDAKADKVCDVCNTQKSHFYFENDNSTCAACELESLYVLVQCVGCSKYAYRSECSTEGQDMSATFSCKRCKPNVLECDICKSVKPNDEFPRQKYSGNVCKRCKSCFKCHFCEQTFTCAKSLVAHHRPTICNKCSPHEHCTCDDCVHKIKNRPILCNVPKCDNYIDRKHVPDEVWRHAVKDNRRLICKECKNKGYDLTDTKEYQCNSEKECVWGHLNFPKQHLADWKMGRTSKLLCKSCAVVHSNLGTLRSNAP